MRAIGAYLQIDPDSQTATLALYIYMERFEHPPPEILGPLVGWILDCRGDLPWMRALILKKR